MQPFLWPELLLIEPLQPHFAPSISYDVGIRGTRIEGLHHASPPEIVIKETATREVHALGESVVRAHHANDRLQSRRPACSDLKGVVRTPRLAHHPNVPRAPRLGSYPLDH